MRLWYCLQELSWLGLRHVKYHAEPHHVPLMGQALVRVIRLASGEAWREEYGDMWSNMWDSACDCMMTVPPPPPLPLRLPLPSARRGQGGGWGWVDREGMAAVN